MRIRIGFVGAGRFAMTKHFPALAHIRDHAIEGFAPELATLVEADGARALAAQRAFGFRRLAPSLDALIGDDDIDARVVVVRPQHLPGVIAALGPDATPLLVEKPPGLTAGDAIGLTAAVPGINVVGFNRRYFPIIERFAALLAGLERVTFAGCDFTRSERLDSLIYARDPDGPVTPFAAGTGVHAVNLLEHLFGPIDACRMRELPRGADDPPAWLCELEHAGGLVGQLRLLPASGASTEWIAVHSRARSLYLRAGLYGSADARGSIEIHENGACVQRIEGVADQPDVVAQGFVGEYLDLFRAIRDGTPTRSNLRNAVRPLAIAAAIEAGHPSWHAGEIGETA